MSRSRSISTEISTDERLGPLGEENPLCVLLYTLAIPHADDWGRLKGDATAFRYEVAPFLLMPASQIEAAPESIAAAGLWVRYEVDGRKFIAFPWEEWCRNQTSIPRPQLLFDRSAFPAPVGWKPLTSEDISYIAERRAWSNMREIVSPDIFARDGYACVYCNSPLNLAIDHVYPLRLGGTHDVSNLVTCCRSCNSSKGAKTLQEWEASR